LIDAAYISEALGGKPKSKGEYQCDCPVQAHRNAKMVIGDKDSSGVWVHCRAGCEFLDIVRELESRGLWPKKNLSYDEKRVIEKRKSAKEVLQAVIWIACYESSYTKTDKDHIKHKRLQAKYKYQLWATKVIDEYRIKIARGYRLSKKQDEVVLKAVNILN